jgi:hypothetical protein
MVRKGSPSVSRARSTRTDMDKPRLDAVVRASVHYYNSEEELDQVCEHVETIVSGRGRIGTAQLVADRAASATRPHPCGRQCASP